MEDVIDIELALIIASHKQKRLLTYSEMADALGVSKAYIQKLKGKELTQEQIEKLNKKFDVDLQYNIYIGDASEVDYYKNEHLTDIIKHPGLRTFSADRQLMELLHRDIKEIRLLSMPGDAMDAGIHPLKNKDILMIDTSKTNPVVAGIYAYTSQNETLLFVSGIRQKGDGSLEFYYNNPAFESVTHSPEQLEQMDFKIIGKVFKNLMAEIS